MRFQTIPRVRLVVLPLILASCVFCAFRAIPHQETVYVVVLFNRSEIVGASSMRSGLFSSTNNGDTWQHSGWNNIRAFGMAADGAHLFLAAGNGILRSADAGASWKIMTDWRVAEALRIAIDDAHHCVISTTAHGVWRSTDFGETWSEYNDGLRSHYASTLLLDASSYRMFLGTEEALYSSTNDGEQWERAEDSVVCGSGILDLQQGVDNPNILYAATEDRAVVRSRDGGFHWTLTANGLKRTPYYCLAVDPRDAQTVYVAGLNSGIWKTTNAGARWDEIGTDSLSGKSFHGLAISRATPRTLFAGEYNGGMWRSTDAGATWKRVGLDGSQVWQVVCQ